jgi:hypothetical protein
VKGQLQAALTNRNVIAFLRVIRPGESRQDDWLTYVNSDITGNTVNFKTVT